jgi:hypothetical protein
VVKTPFSDEITLLWIWLDFINVDDVPLLVGTFVFTVNLDIASLYIFGACDVKDLSFNVFHVGSLESEQLPPS